VAEFFLVASQGSIKTLQSILGLKPSERETNDSSPSSSAGVKVAGTYIHSSVVMEWLLVSVQSLFYLLALHDTQCVTLLLLGKIYYCNKNLLAY
jgi:hypothetical protein